MPLSLSMVGRLEHQHETISELIEGESEARVKEPIYPDKWSAFENIVHLAAYQPTFIQRLELILDGNKPKFARYVADNDPLFHEYLKKSIPELLRVVAADRLVITDRLINLNREELQRQAYHPKFGCVSIDKWTEFFLLHEAHHLFAIIQLIGALYVTPQ